jgi:hypothetical protein
MEHASERCEPDHPGPTVGQVFVSKAGNVCTVFERVAFIRLDLKNGTHYDACVDPEDVQLVTGHPYKWRALWSPEARTFYAAARNADGKSTVLMHRLMMNPPPDMEVDHKNHHGLENQRDNLEVCTPKENSANRRAQWKAHADSKSKYRHVYWNKVSNGYRAIVRIDGKRKDIPGSYPTPEAARDALAAHKESLGLPA